MNKLETNLLKRYVGYIGERDEYQQGIINEILTTSYIYSFYLISIFMLISLVFDTLNHTLTFGTFALLFIQQFNAFYTVIKLRKSGVDKTEFYDDMNYSSEIKKLRRQIIIAAIQWAFLMFIMLEYIFPSIAGERIDIHVSTVLKWICGGVFFGGSMYIVGRSKLIKLKEND